MKRLIVVLAFALVACAGATLKESINTGVKTADIYIKQTTELLQAGAITPATAQARLDIIKQAETGLQAASQAEASCTSTLITPTPCSNAQTAYNAANALLDSTLTWLIAHGKTGK
jgi:hypothetical protein